MDHSAYHIIEVVNILYVNLSVLWSALFHIGMVIKEVHFGKYSKTP